MAKFVFLVPPLTGHVNPTLSIGAELLSRGHEVAWISLDAELIHRLPEGGKLWCIGQDTEGDGRDYLDRISQKIVYGIDSIKFLYEEVLVPLNRYCYPYIRERLQLFQPDLVIADHQLFSGLMAASVMGLPCVTCVTAPAAIRVMEELPGVHAWEMKQVADLQHELGIVNEQVLSCSALLTLVLTSKAFFGEMDLPDFYRFVGPVIVNRKEQATFDYQQTGMQESRARILVTIGTTFDHIHKKNFFTRVRAAFADQELTVIVISEPGLFDYWPENFIVQKHIPQLELLPYLDAVVCHGGHNTVVEALFSGLPLVVIPIAYDQSHVAGRIVRTGAGIRLNFNRFKASQLQEAVWEVLTDQAYRMAAAQLKLSFIQAGGKDSAADLLTEMAGHQDIPVTNY